MEEKVVVTHCFTWDLNMRGFRHLIILWAEYYYVGSKPDPLLRLISMGGYPKKRCLCLIMTPS